MPQNAWQAEKLLIPTFRFVKMKLLNGLYLCASLLASIGAHAGEIALTFDDAPLAGSSLVSGEDKTEKIIQALKSRSVEDVLFFVTTKNISDQVALKRVQRYAEEGFHLANHSHAHLSANKIEPADYLTDVFTSHLILQHFEGFSKLHRHPFLHQGSDEETRETIWKGLTNLGYELGYVTVDNYEWYINSKVVEAYDAGRKIDFEKLKALYIDTLWAGIQFYDSIAKEVLGRSPKHILLLHENDLAALFVGDLIDHIRAQGWKIISPQEAYEDPIATQYTPAFEFTNQGRIAAIAHSKGMKKRDLVHVSEDTDYLDKAFEKYGVFD